LRGRLGHPTNAGFLWGAFCAALDLTHPDALGYAAETIHTAVHRWGFPYLKLDFLYAAALPGRRHDPTRTRAQALRAGLEAVRQAAGDQAFLLGCGCPLGPAIGLLDAMRIGADVARRWNPSFKEIEFFIKGEPDLPAARNASHNALARAPLHHRWWINDPDCLLLRPETRLTLAEVQTLATIVALTGGSLFISDHLPSLPPDRLRLAECLLPTIGRRPHVLDWFDHPTPRHLQLDLDGPAGAWHLIALFNWGEHPSELVLKLTDFYLDPQLTYYAREFWSGKIYRFDGKELMGNELTIPDVPAHGVQLFAVRPRHPYQPQYLGSDLHISQGLELTEWEDSKQGLHLRLQRPGPAHGKIMVALPRQPDQELQDDLILAWESLDEGVYLVSVNFDKIASIKIRY
jgi:alpha-galactosidase